MGARGMAGAERPHSRPKAVAQPQYSMPDTRAPVLFRPPLGHHGSDDPTLRCKSRTEAQNLKDELTSKTAATIANAMKATNEKAATSTEAEIVCEMVPSQRSSSAR